MHYREHHEDPPAYVLYPDEESNTFTVRVVYNGFFTGLRDNLEYVSATVAYFDNCTGDTWSLYWIDEILRQLDEKRDGRMQIYWCLPDKDLEDGLVLIDKHSHIVQMVKACKYHKTLTSFVDHTNFLQRVRPELIQNLPALSTDRTVRRTAASAEPEASNSVLVEEKMKKSLSSEERKLPTVDASVEPSKDNMVYKMQQEQTEHVPMSRLLGPLPDNAFVVAARESIPQSKDRVTTATTRGNLRGRGRGRNQENGAARFNGPAEQAKSSRGTRNAKKRSSHASTSATTQAAENPEPEGGRTSRRARTEEIPDLNAEFIPDVHAKRFL